MVQFNEACAQDVFVIAYHIMQFILNLTTTTIAFGKANEDDQCRNRYMRTVRFVFIAWSAIGKQYYLHCKKYAIIQGNICYVLQESSRLC